MVSIADTTLPGVSATVESANTLATATSSPGDIGIVGPADLSAGTALKNEAYRITTTPQAHQVFGTDSPLAVNVSDALFNGAFPVYAAAPESVAVVGEDISGLGTTSGTLANAPVTEDETAVTFTVDGVVLTTIKTLEDPSTKAPAADEVYYNPQTAAFELESAPSDADATNDTVDYEYHDYPTAIDALEAEYGETVDFIGSLAENAAVVTDVQTTVGAMANKRNFATAVAGASSYISNTSNYSNTIDDSRVQLLYPARKSDGNSLVGAYLGLRAAIGIDSSAMKTRLRGVTALNHSLGKAQKEELDAENVVVLADESAGSLIENDPTCVLDSNAEEAQMRDGLSRMIVDYVTEIVFAQSEPFVGGYHSDITRSQLRGNLDNRLSALQETNAILKFEIRVTEVDSYTAAVDLSVQTVKPLRNVKANIVAGEVTSGVGA